MYIRGSHTNVTDDARFTETAPIPSPLVWQGMYDGAETETDFLTNEDYDPDADADYLTGRY